MYCWVPDDFLMGLMQKNDCLLKSFSGTSFLLVFKPFIEKRLMLIIYQMWIMTIFTVSLFFY